MTWIGSEKKRLENMIYLPVTWNGCPEIIIESLSNEDGNGQRERYKTIHLITEYNDLTWEYNHLATFPSSSSETAREKLDSGVLQRTRS